MVFFRARLAQRNHRRYRGSQRQVDQPAQRTTNNKQRTSAMIIKELKVHQIAIADPPLRSSYGLHAPYALRTIIELKSDEGVIGISETYGGEAQIRSEERR